MRLSSQILRRRSISTYNLKNYKNKNVKYAKSILNKREKKLTYFKLPAYVHFTDSLLITSSQKIMKKDLIKKKKKKKQKFL